MDGNARTISHLFVFQSRNQLQIILLMVNAIISWKSTAKPILKINGIQFLDINEFHVLHCL